MIKSEETCQKEAICMLGLELQWEWIHTFRAEMIAWKKYEPT